MKEYIERNALLTQINKNRVENSNERCAQILEAIIYTPAADVAEVRHGEWVEQLDGTHYCSKCGHDATYTYDGTEVCRIGCPFCYAKMDGKGEDNDNL